MKKKKKCIGNRMQRYIFTFKRMKQWKKKHSAQQYTTFSHQQTKVKAHPQQPNPKLYVNFLWVDYNFWTPNHRKSLYFLFLYINIHFKLPIWQKKIEVKYNEAHSMFQKVAKSTSKSQSYHKISSAWNGIVVNNSRNLN